MTTDYHAAAEWHNDRLPSFLIDFMGLIEDRKKAYSFVRVNS
jgi:hypothetical protein